MMTVDFGEVKTWGLFWGCEPPNSVEVFFDGMCAYDLTVVVIAQVGHLSRAWKTFKQTTMALDDTSELDKQEQDMIVK